MTEQSSAVRSFAARLAQGPAFLIAGEDFKTEFGPSSIAYSWSGIYTSCTDNSTEQLFRSEQRVVAPTGPMNFAASRSKSNLEVRYLFGATHLPEVDQPSSDTLEIEDMRLRRVQELSRLATETVTPRGLIVISGWAPGDKLSVQELIPSLRNVGVGQIHLFSGDKWEKDPFVASLAKTGQLVAHKEKLDEVLGILDESGSLPTKNRSQISGGVQRIVSLGESFTEIDIHTWNQIRRSARPIDLELLTPPLFSSEAARYQEFREFMGATESSPRWRGIAAELNIRRNFEKILATRVDQILEEHEFQKPIVVVGQTATGKSIAMATLALDLARAGQVAVLHQSRRGARPSFEDIEMYAAWSEEHGAKATVLIWDGMVELSEYSLLARQLRNRGRKVLVVGSAYMTKDDSANIIEAPAHLDNNESTELIGVLRSFGVDISIPKGVLDSSFLAFLYHALPETEHALKHGLAFEMRAAEQGMERLVLERGEKVTFTDRLGSMAAALMSAGVKLGGMQSPNSDSESPIVEKSFDERSPVQKVTTLVLVAGRHGTAVPIDLALRLLGRHGSEDIRDALNTFDIIRELDDGDGEYFLTTRSRLEAELLSQQDISIGTEVEVVCDVIRNIRINEGYVSGPDEVQFLVSILERIGPKGEHSQKYREFFGELVEELRERREMTGRAHPRLVLQESILTRERARRTADLSNEATSNMLFELEHNRNLLDEVLSSGHLSLMLRLSLTVELASTLGVIMNITAVSESSPQERSALVNAQLDDILKAVQAARSIDPGNLYPVDVLAWSTRQAIETQALSAGERLHRLANAVATIESIDRSSISPRESARLEGRNVELNRLLGNDTAIFDSIRNLEENSDPAAVYILAKFEAEKGPIGEANALQSLRNASRQTRLDWRCAQLLLDLTWKHITGTRLLQGERVPIHLSANQVHELASVVNDLQNSEFPDRYKLLFIKALILFISGSHSEAKRAFRDVESHTRQLSKRIQTAVVLADENGKPQIFTGHVERADTKSGDVWVNELGVSVRFEPHLFSVGQQFVRHQALPAFMIGFKLTRGAVAEPRTMFRKAR